MENKYAFLFPGQGSQYVGMGRELYDHFPVAKETFQEADERLGFSLSKLIFEGPLSELSLTKNCQAAIYTVSIAIWRTILDQFPDLRPSVCAGHSLGEYSAITAAKRIPFADCLSLVRARGECMHLAAEKVPGSMAAVLGLDSETIAQALQSDLTSPQKVWIANLNCPSQVVISGDAKALEEAASVLKIRGARRVIPLEVSGAFHSKLMLPAQESMAPKLALAPLIISDIDVVMNVTGRYVSSVTDMRNCLSDQITSQVLWEKGILNMTENGVTLFVEIGAGRVLSGMNRKIGVKSPTISIEKIADLEMLANTLDQLRGTYATVKG